MSFAIHPATDACREPRPRPDPLPPGPVNPPQVCHRPAGHDGPHSIDRELRTLSWTWGDEA